MALSLFAAALVPMLISVLVDGMALAEFERSWDRLGTTGQWPAGTEREWSSDGWIRSIALASQCAGAVVFLVWLWRARRNAEVLFAGRHRRSIGWVIWGWVCPVVNLWFPHTIMADLVRASDPRTPGGDLRGQPGIALVSAWWVAVLAGWWLSFVALVLRLPVTRTESTTSYIAVGIAPLGGFGLIVVELILVGVLVVAGVLLGVIMMRVQRGQEVRAGRGSGALAVSGTGSTSGPTPPGQSAEQPPTLPMRDTDPATLGRFALLGRLGATSSGDSYLGRDENSGLVVVRTMRPLSGDRGELARAFAAVRAVPSKYAPAVLDVDAAGEMPWIATEYVAGPTLRDLVHARGPLPCPQVENMAVELAHALSAVHAAGITHGALTPDVVISTASGPRVLGIGLPVPPPSAFSAPEQLTGESGGPAADVFALGGVLVYALTGRAPFGDGTGANLLHRMTTQPPDLAGIPESRLRILLIGCLAVTPDARLSTAQIVGQLGTASPLDPVPAPRGAARRLPVPAPQPSSSTTVGPGTRRRTVLLAGGAAALGLAGVGALAATRPWQGGSESGGAAAESTPGRVRWTIGPTPYVDAESTPPAVYGGRLFVADKDMLTALDASTGSRVWQVPLGNIDVVKGPMVSGDTVVVASSRLVAGFDPGNGAMRWQVAAYALFVLTAGNQPAQVYTESSLGKEIIALDARTGQQRWGSFRDRDSGGSLAVGGDTVAVVDGTAVALLDAASGAEKRRIELATGGSNDRAIASGTEVAVVGKQLLVQRFPEHVLEMYDFATGERLWTLSSESAFGVADGDIVYLGGARREYGGGEPAVAPLSAHDTRTRRKLWQETQRVIGAPTIADGTVYAVWGSELSALDAATGEIRWSTTGLRATSSPVVVGDTAYVHSRTGVVAVEI
ncbi:PQQ-binding-like beta-propeller repeat protein [Nocardia neocaledoniensis]|uniref:outer membrane protein assembly factor BamB family protein n=1 Tax=Nocardia neocaledoniensis TaxID=236511 RepID=UPI0034059465